MAKAKIDANQKALLKLAGFLAQLAAKSSYLLKNPKEEPSKRKAYLAHFKATLEHAKECDARTASGLRKLLGKLEADGGSCLGTTGGTRPHAMQIRFSARKNRDRIMAEMPKEINHADKLQGSFDGREHHYEGYTGHLTGWDKAELA